jgi:undecaprenyl-diphosphatase
MDYLHAVIMGIIQGITEFLPVSSSAHLALYPKVFNVSSTLLNSLSFDVALHAGTLVALLVFFRKRVVELLLAFFKGLVSAKSRQAGDFKLGMYIIAATLPAAVIGVKWGEKLEEAFRAPAKVGAVLIIFGLILWMADRIGTKRKEMDKINFFDSFVIGCAQALALIPGVSRSGASISGGLFLGYKRHDAAEFSFILSMPAVAGAFAMELKHMLKASESGGLSLEIVGFAAALISGLLVLKLFLDYVKKHSYAPFVIYRVLLGAAILIFLR